MKTKIKVSVLEGINGKTNFLTLKGDVTLFSCHFTLTCKFCGDEIFFADEGYCWEAGCLRCFKKSNSPFPQYIRDESQNTPDIWTPNPKQIADIEKRKKDCERAA